VRGFEFRAAGRQAIDLGWRAAFPDWQPAEEKGDEVQLLPPVCTENLIRVDAVMESPKLAE
jgi:DNA topoisomerase III